MHIGIASWCNPNELKEFITSQESILDVNKNSTSVNTYVRELLVQGHVVTLFTSYEGCRNVIEYHGPQLHVYLVPRKCKLRQLSLFSPLYFFKRLERVMEKHLDGVDVLHAQWTYDFALAAKKFAKLMPVFCTVRDWCPYIRSMQKKIIPKIYWGLCNKIFKKVMGDDDIHFIANSNYTYACIKNAYPAKEVGLIPNPIQKEIVLDEFVCDSKKNPSFITICQSIDEPRKNIITLLKSFALFRQKHANAELFVVGGYSQSSRVITLAQRENLLAGVHFLGRVAHCNVFEYIDQSHCLVHPSLEETFGNILLEAMARGVVCIGGAKSGAVPSVLGNGLYGILCDVTDVASLASAMEKSLDKDTTTPIVSSAMSCLKREYLSDVVVKKQMAEYFRLLK